jgi:hypothetical protein
MPGRQDAQSTPTRFSGSSHLASGVWQCISTLIITSGSSAHRPEPGAWHTGRPIPHRLFHSSPWGGAVHEGGIRPLTLGPCSPKFLREQTPAVPLPVSSSFPRSLRLPHMQSPVTTGSPKRQESPHHITLRLTELWTTRRGLHAGNS